MKFKKAFRPELNVVTTSQRWRETLFIVISKVFYYFEMVSIKNDKKMFEMDGNDLLNRALLVSYKLVSG